MRTMSGGCLCGSKRFSVDVTSDDACLCHCRTCQRAAGAVSVAFTTVKASALTWTQAPDVYASSAHAHRGFCAGCGTSLFWRENDGDEVDLHVAAFDEPGFFRCTHHSGAEDILRHWLDTSGLPEKITPPRA